MIVAKRPSGCCHQVLSINLACGVCFTFLGRVHLLLNPHTTAPRSYKTLNNTHGKIRLRERLCEVVPTAKNESCQQHRRAKRCAAARSCWRVRRLTKRQGCGGDVSKLSGAASSLVARARCPSVNAEGHFFVAADLFQRGHNIQQVWDQRMIIHLIVDVSELDIAALIDHKCAAKLA
jgi:hypothetical protein